MFLQRIKEDDIVYLMLIVVVVFRFNMKCNKTEKRYDIISNLNKSGIE